MKRGQKRLLVQRQRDRLTITQMSLRGHSQMEIADYLEMSQAQVSRELKQVKDDWRRCAVRDRELERGRTLSKLELVEKEFGCVAKNLKSTICSVEVCIVQNYI